MTEQPRGESLRSDEERVAEIRQAAREGRIEFASQDRVEQLQQWIDKVLLVVLGHNEAWVSDESCICDFAPTMHDEKGRTISMFDDDFDRLAWQRCRSKWLYEISTELGLELKINDYVVDVAERLKKIEEEMRKGTK